MSSIPAREFHSRFARILAVRDAVFTESLGSLLSRADGAGLADATNYAILPRGLGNAGGINSLPMAWQQDFWRTPELPLDGNPARYGTSPVKRSRLSGSGAGSLG
jgi:hypothetical protein